MKISHLTALTPTLLLSLVLATSCQPADVTDAGSDAGEEAIDLAHLSGHVCTHFQTGTPVAVTAAAARDTGAAQVGIGHELHAVSLVSFEGAQGGYLRLIPDEEAHVALFLSQDVPVAVEDASGVARAVHDQLLQPATCAAIRKALLYELQAATSYLRLGPTSESAVDLVAEEAAHEHE
jgi:hypothetical protein